MGSKQIKKTPAKGEKKIQRQVQNKKPLSPETRKRRLALACIVGLFGFLLYTNTLRHGYVLDDFSAIKENNIVRQGLHAIPEIFRTSYRQGYLSVKDGLYRPLSLATFAIEWNYFPDTPSVSHLVNVLLYGITGILLFFLLCCFVPKGSEHLPSGTISAGEAFAFLTSLLFIAHPLHVEVVANIKSRDEILCFLFVLCSFLSVFRFIESEKKKFLWMGLLAFSLSLLSKETSITFLALLPIALLFFTAVPIKRNLVITSYFIATAFVYLILRSRVLQGALSDNTVAISDNVVAGANTFSTHAGTSFFILGQYIKLLFFPHPLSYDYSYAHIQLVELGNIVSTASLLFYLTIGTIALFILYRHYRAKLSNPLAAAGMPELISFALLFFLATIFLFSNLVLIIGTSMGDRLMYFPSLGFCMCIAALYMKFLSVPGIDIKQPKIILKLLPFFAVILLFSAKSWSRNYDWKNNNTLYAHDVELVPNSIKAHYYYGLDIIKTVAADEPDTEKKNKLYELGIKELERAIELFPTFTNAYTQLGVAYYRLKNFDMAIKNYNKSIELNHHDAIPFNNIGIIYFEEQKYPQARESFERALQIDSRFVDAYMNLGSVLGVTKDYNNAIASYEKALLYAPDNARAYYFIAVTYVNMGDKVKADKYFQIAEQMDPSLRRP